MHQLGISIGSASQGLRTLRNLKAVKSSYVPGKRKDHFLAETEFRRLFSNFIKDEILPHLEELRHKELKASRKIHQNVQMMKILRDTYWSEKDSQRQEKGSYLH